MILNLLRARDTDRDARAFLVELKQHSTISPGEKTEHQKIRDHFLLPETELILKSIYFSLKSNLYNFFRGFGCVRRTSRNNDFDYKLCAF
jgi:hypothetical protein